MSGFIESSCFMWLCNIIGVIIDYVNSHSQFGNECRQLKVEQEHIEGEFADL